MDILRIKTERRRLGDLGERRAARYLFFRGYRILERNYVSDGGEVDIIARRGDTLVFAEVKTRTESKRNAREERPASSVTPEKQRKIIAVAKRYKALNYSKFNGLKMRFDIIEVLTERANGRDKVLKIIHLISAFDGNTAYGRP